MTPVYINKKPLSIDLEEAMTASGLHIMSKSIYIIAAAMTATARGIEASKKVFLDESKDAAEEPDLVK